jgi:hypothetical protein
LKTALDAKRHPRILVSRMNLAAASGSFVSAGAMRPAARILGALVGVRDAVVVLPLVVVLPVVGLLIGLLLITAGCGPPN